MASENVHYHLVREEYDLLRGYTKQGVQVVSPLTLGHKLELIDAHVQAHQLSEQAEAVLERLEVPGERFDDLNDEWDTLFHHLRNPKTSRRRRLRSRPPACGVRPHRPATSRGRRGGRSVRRGLTAGDATRRSPPL
jgi:hypothetical protein